MLTVIPPIMIVGDKMTKTKKCENCTCSKYRTEEEKKDLTRRLKIISGQVNGILQMIENDRYCDDVLLQIASVTNALKSLGGEVLKSHMKSCMIEDIEKGNFDVIDDVFNLFGKLK